MPNEYLRDVEFPATKQELIDAAVEADAPQDAIERLQSLSREHYDDAAELDAELGESGED